MSFCQIATTYFAGFTKKYKAASILIALVFYYLYYKQLETKPLFTHFSYNGIWNILEQINESEKEIEMTK